MPVGYLGSIEYLTDCQLEMTESAIEKSESPIEPQYIPIQSRFVGDLKSSGRHFLQAT